MLLVLLHVLCCFSGRASWVAPLVTTYLAVESVLPSLALLSQLLQGALSSFLEAAEELAKDQQRADEAKTIEHIDGRKDVQELVERNAARVRQRDAVGEASDMFATGSKLRARA